MAREDINKEIDGENYMFKALPATQSLKLAIKIIRFAGLPLTVTLDSVFSGSGDQKKEVSKELGFDTNLENEIKFSDIGEAIVGRLDTNEEEVIDIIKASLKATLHSGSGLLSSPGIFDVHFSGRLAHMGKVFFAALEAEYQDFFNLIRVNSQVGIDMLHRLGQKREKDTKESGEENSR